MPGEAMELHIEQPRKLGRASSAKMRVVGIQSCILVLLASGCGPEDYQKPIQQFQDASAVVIAATQDFLNNENLIEQNKAIDQAIFEEKGLDLRRIDQIQNITPDEIKLRTGALDALTSYLSLLGQLAQGKATSDLDAKAKTLQSATQTLLTDLGKVPAVKGTILDNAKFSGVASAAVQAFGAVARLVEERKARREIESSLVSTDKAISDLIQTISDDCTVAYARQKNALGEHQVELINDYKDEIAKKDKNGTPDRIELLQLAGQIKDLRSKETTLPAANPAATILKMNNAHRALVNYVKSPKTPKSFQELVSAVEDFARSAQPLGEAAHSLWRAV
jgi:hypothetical protein